MEGWDFGYVSMTEQNSEVQLELGEASQLILFTLFTLFIIIHHHSSVIISVWTNLSWPGLWLSLSQSRCCPRWWPQFCHPVLHQRTRARSSFWGYWETTFNCVNQQSGFVMTKRTYRNKCYSQKKPQREEKLRQQTYSSRVYLSFVNINTSSYSV